MHYQMTKEGIRGVYFHRFRPDIYFFHFFFSKQSPLEYYNRQLVFSSNPNLLHISFTISSLIVTTLQLCHLQPENELF